MAREGDLADEEEMAMPRMWDDVLSEQDRLIYQKAGFGAIPSTPT